MDERRHIQEVFEALVYDTNWEDDDGDLEKAKRAVVRAAAEITGLTAEQALAARELIDSGPINDYSGAHEALRRYAELASGDLGQTDP